MSAVPATGGDALHGGLGIRVLLRNEGFEPIYLRNASLGLRIAREDLGFLGWRGLVQHGEWHRSWWYLSTELPEAARNTFPCTIEPGRSEPVWLRDVDMERHFAQAVDGKVRLLVQDELDRTFASPLLPNW